MFIIRLHPYRGLPLSEYGRTSNRDEAIAVARELSRDFPHRSVSVSVSDDILVPAFVVALNGYETHFPWALTRTA